MHGKIVFEDCDQTLSRKTLWNPTIVGLQIKNDTESNYTLTSPTLSANAVIATQEWVNGKNYLSGHQSLDGCVKTSGNQTIAGTKTFSAAPNLSTNTIKRSNDAVITLPDATGKLATLAGTETLQYKTLDNTCDIDAVGIRAATASYLAQTIIDIVYPVGIVCFFYSDVDPESIFPGNTRWVQLNSGYYIKTKEWGVESATGGSSTSGSTTLQLTQIPKHSHTATSTFTGTQASGSVQSRRASAANNISNYGTNSNVSFTVTEQTGDSWKSATSTTSKQHNTDVLTWTYTPKGSVSTSTGNSGGGGGHTHTIEPPYITLSDKFTFE